MQLLLCVPTRAAMLVAASPALAASPFISGSEIEHPLADTIRLITTRTVAANSVSLPLRRAYPTPKTRRAGKGQSSDLPIGHPCRPVFMKERHLDA
jgi:hypothetical protein